MATNTPMAPMVVNNEGNTETISPGPAIKPPASSYISTPLASATYIAGKISIPANTAMPTSSSATRLPMVGRFSLLLM